MTERLTFTAKYHGKCAGGCNTGIHPGDEVTYEDQALMHTDCENSEGLREYEPEVALIEPEHPTCTTCWLIHPPGACDL